MRRPAVGHADLLRFVAAEHDPVLRRQAAALLGLPLPPASLFTDLEPDTGPPIPPPAHATLARLPLRCPVLMHAMPLPATSAPALASESATGLTAWSPAEAAEVEAMLALPDLAQAGHRPLSPRATWRGAQLPRSLALLGHQMVDFSALLRRVALARFAWPVPLRPVQQPPQRLVVLIDWSSHLRCFDEDFQGMAQALRSNSAAATVEVWFLPDGPAAAPQAAWPGMASRPWDSQTLLLLLSDMGASQAAALRDWLTRLRRWRRQAGRLVAWVPCQTREVPAAVRSLIPVLPMAPGRGGLPGEGSQQLKLLMAALAPALTVEPRLLRAMRLALLPASSPLLEVAVWQHADLAGGLPFRQWLPQRQQAWLAALQELPSALLGQVDRVLTDQHQHCPQAQRDEEAMLLGSLAFEGDDAADLTAGAAGPGAWRTRYEAARGRCERVAQHLLHLGAGPPGEGGRRPVASPHCVASKAAERLTRMPVRLRAAGLAGADLLFAATRPAQLVADGTVVVVPEGVSPHHWQTLETPPDWATPLPLALWQRGQSLWLLADDGPAAQAPAGVLLSRWVLAKPWLDIETGGGRRSVAVKRLCLPLRLQQWHGTPPADLVLRWQGGGLKVCPVLRPRGSKAWAQAAPGPTATVDGMGGADVQFAPADLGWEPRDKAAPIGSMRVTHASRLNRISSPSAVWGFDTQGAFCTMRFRGVTVAQTLRYIEPGSFQMGSPLDEPDRDDDEGPRHPVTISRGFWLADTPCTQALWQAVMGGKNPSRFKDGPNAADCPVEQVSWDGVQHFLKRLQALLPAGCEAGLPTEAEWEYAARAGSQTAYAWGDRPDAERANMDRKVGRTTPVKQYPANAWGLHDLHGNVWEWCADDRRDYRDRPEVDPSGGVGAHRAVRGGSWFSVARFLRSARRLRYRRGFRFHSLGFRVALRSPSPGGPGPVLPGGQDLETGQRPALAAGGSPGPAEPGGLAKGSTPTQKRRP